MSTLEHKNFETTGLSNQERQSIVEFTSKINTDPTELRKLQALLKSSLA